MVVTMQETQSTSMTYPSLRAVYFQKPVSSSLAKPFVEIHLLLSSLKDICQSPVVEQLGLARTYVSAKKGGRI